MNTFYRFSLTLFLCGLAGSVILYSFSEKKIQSQDFENKITEQKGELERVRKELEEKRKKIEKLSKKESSVFIGIKNLEEEIELIDKLISRLNTKSSQVKKEIMVKEKLLEESQSSLQVKREELGLRLRDIYKYMRFREYEVLIGASSPLDLLRRLRFIKLITQQDQALIQEVAKEVESVEVTRRSLESKKNELSLLIKEKNSEEKKREIEKNKKEKNLKAIRTEKETYLKTVKELEKSAKEIEKLLSSLEEERFKRKTEVAAGLFRALKGRLSWPIKGKVTLGFGEQKEPRFNTNVFNPGIDISPESDKEVKAVAEGKVVYSSWLRGYGNFIILQHDEGYYTVYANLKEILAGTGEKISSSQVIGIIDGSENNLHFEIRKGKQQIDPLEWLR